MRDGWIRTTLGEIAVLEYGRALKEADRDGEGFPVFGSAGIVGWHSEPSVIDAPLIIIGRKGQAGAVIWSDTPGSPIDTTYWVRILSSDIDPRFLYLALSAAGLPGLCAQTGVPGLNRGRAYSAVISMPPRSEQRRIVDLIASLDDAARHARETRQRTASALEVVIASLVDPISGERQHLVDLMEHVIGGAWGEPPGVEEFDVRALGLLIFQGDPIAVDPDRSSERSLSAARATSRLLQFDDIVIERSGGTDEQPVGRVVRADHDAVNVVPTDFMRLLRVNEALAEPRYIFWLLWSWYKQGRTRSFQSQTTNIRNLRIPEYLSSTAILPPREEQVRAIEVADAFWHSRKRLDELLLRLQRLRAGLLADLLSGEREIPASYDRLLESA